MIFNGFTPDLGTPKEARKKSMGESAMVSCQTLSRELGWQRALLTSPSRRIARKSSFRDMGLFLLSVFPANKECRTAIGCLLEEIVLEWTQVFGKQNGEDYLQSACLSMQSKIPKKAPPVQGKCLWKFLVGRAGIEPATLCLKGRYSTD